jgi:hypothetical protein
VRAKLLAMVTTFSGAENSLPENDRASLIAFDGLR